MTTEINPEANRAESPARGNGKRRKALMILAAVVVVAGIAWLLYWLLYARWHEDTNDAYVQGNVVTVTPQVGGTVVGIAVDDGMRVEAGQVLVRFDHTDTDVAYQEAVAGDTTEQRAIARANVAKATASIDTIKAQVNELTVKAPIAGQVYQIGAELGEYVAPGVPLLSLVDLSDVWLRFNLREDLVKNLKVGDRFQIRIPALGDRLITCAIKTIAARGEYTGWRATRATGDFDLRTFEVRAYPVDPVPELRPGMSVYAEAPGAK